MKRIAIESPLSGDEATNKAFAENVCKWVSANGDSPYAMHLFFTRFLNESIPEQREQGIRGGLAWVSAADEVWFCLNADAKVLRLSGGMLQALHHLEAMSNPPRCRYFTFTQSGQPVNEYTSPDFASIE